MEKSVSFFVGEKMLISSLNEEMYNYRIETGGTAGEIIKNAKLRKFWKHTINDGRGSDSENWPRGISHVDGS